MNFYFKTISICKWHTQRYKSNTFYSLTQKEVIILTLDAIYTQRGSGADTVHVRSVHRKAILHPSNLVVFQKGSECPGKKRDAMSPNENCQNLAIEVGMVQDDSLIKMKELGNSTFIL